MENNKRFAMKDRKLPLKIYVLWHQNFGCGNQYAEELYSCFTRNINDPISRGIGIPVMFPHCMEHKIDINFETSDRTAIVVLIDENILLDESWYAYLNELQEACDASPKRILFPVAIIRSAFNLPDKSINSKNYIRLYEIEETRKISHLKFILSHELCRFLYDVERISEIEMKVSPPPVKLFLSHAKADGLMITKSIRSYIKENTSLDDFFDTYDIPPGYNFGDVIESAIPNCLLLVVHTDEYSSRNWCRKEVLLSKELSVPILVLDCLKEIEKRSFPYMANVQTLRVNTEEINHERIIFAALIEILRYKYQALFCAAILDSFECKITNNNILGYPPELYTLVQVVDKKDGLVLYPDPPLSNDELSVLKKYNNDITYITPTLLSCIDVKTKVFTQRVIKDLKVGLSISEIDEENSKGINNFHIQDILVEISRYLMTSGAKLLYGGDIRYREDFNFVRILKDLAENYNYEFEETDVKIINYVANYLRQHVSDQLRAELIKIVGFSFVDPLVDINYDLDDPLYKRYSRARDLSNMRTKMNKDLDVRILLGGKKNSFQGLYPGLFEEALLALQLKKAVFLLGGFGGVTEEIIMCILGKKSEVFTKDYQCRFNDYGRFYDYYNDLSTRLNIASINYEEKIAVLAKEGVAGLNNGLSYDENLRLFESTNFTEIISLVLKGLIIKLK
jgi:hypothetical protein